MKQTEGSITEWQLLHLQIKSAHLVQGLWSYVDKQDWMQTANVITQTMDCGVIQITS